MLLVSVQLLCGISSRFAEGRRGRSLVKRSQWCATAEHKATPADEGRTAERALPTRLLRDSVLQARP
eukprot:gene7004-23957_t